MKKPLLAAFVVAAMAIGLLIILLIGVFRVDEDGRETDGARPPAVAGAVQQVTLPRHALPSPGIDPGMGGWTALQRS
jgi:hypothetical protein